MTLDDAIAAIDAVNAEDPRRLRGRPMAQVEGEMVSDWVQRLRPDAPEPLVLAARAHHIKRWESPRDAYPDGRPGYLRWRRDQKDRHASAVADVLRAMDSAVVARVQNLVRKRDLANDPDVQTLEDAICLVFLETQLTELADKVTDDDKMVTILRKTLPKMSEVGRQAALRMELDDRAAALLRAAVG